MMSRYARSIAAKIERSHRRSAANSGSQAVKHADPRKAYSWARKAASAGLQVVKRSPLHGHPDSKRTRRSRLVSIQRTQARQLKMRGAR